MSNVEAIHEFTNDAELKLENRGAMPTEAPETFYNMLVRPFEQLQARKRAAYEAEQAEQQAILEMEGDIRRAKLDYESNPAPQLLRKIEAQESRQVRRREALDKAKAARAAEKSIFAKDPAESQRELGRNPNGIFRLAEPPELKPRKGESDFDYLKRVRSNRPKIFKAIEVEQAKWQPLEEIESFAKSVFKKSLTEHPLSEFSKFFHRKWRGPEDTRGSQIMPETQTGHLLNLVRPMFEQAFEDFLQAAAKRNAHRMVTKEERAETLKRLQRDLDENDRIDCALVRKIRAADPSNMEVFFRPDANILHCLGIEPDDSVEQPKPGKYPVQVYPEVPSGAFVAGTVPIGPKFGEQ